MIYKGKLNIDDYGCLECGDSYLAESVEADFKKGDKVFARYYITDKEVTEEEAKEALILKTIGGNIDECQFILDAYSEYTIIELEEHLTIGGHDLIDELSNADGKYLILIIEKDETSVSS
jgi:hypothetical protein